MLHGGVYGGCGGCLWIWWGYEGWFAVRGNWRGSKERNCVGFGPISCLVFSTKNEAASGPSFAVLLFSCLLFCDMLFVTCCAVMSGSELNPSCYRLPLHLILSRLSGFGQANNPFLQAWLDKMRGRK